MNRARLLGVMLLFAAGAYAQDEESRKWSLDGYIKDLVTLNIPEGGDSVLWDNLIHNRVNFRWFPTDQFTFRMDLRTRLFHGDLVRTIPNYGDLIDVNDDFLDLSARPIDGEGVVLHTMIDRAYVQWKQDTWELTAGRQRINWGVNLAWNPNDIFNAYSFFDFDYEERPGSDAIRFQRYIGFAGSLQVATKITDRLDELTSAFLYKWNYKGYDMQLLTGVMRENVTIGGAWAGNLKLAGFKGEFTYFEPWNDEDKRTFLGSISVDYSFSNSLYLNGSFLYNSAADGNNPLFLQSAANLDVRALSPFTWSTFLQSSYPINPLLNGGMSIIYYPGEPGIFLNPFMTYSVSTNLDLDLIGQFFVQGEPAAVSLLYFRVKYSF
ncbi:MAG: hypothetical protein AAGA85_08530 [Bacteroidota bacterium]